jgi:hypothetical protein
VGEGDLVRDAAAINLDLHQVRLLLFETSLADLGVGEDTDDGAVTADAFEFALNALLASSLGALDRNHFSTYGRRMRGRMKLHLLGVVSKGFLLAAVPVLVEPTLDLIREVRSPDSGEGAETARSLNVADDTDDDEGRGLDDSDSLDNLTFVHLCARIWR